MSTPFKAHGYHCISNCGGVEIQISDDGSTARLRYYTHEHTPQHGVHIQEPTPWLEVQYDASGEPYIEYKTSIEYLNKFMRL